MQNTIEELLERFSLEKDQYKRVSYFIRLAIGTTDVLIQNDIVKQMIAMMSEEVYQDKRGRLLNQAWIEYVKSLGMFFLPDENNKSQILGNEVIAQNEKALALFEELGEEAGQAETLTNIALINWAKGNYKTAFEQAFRAITLARHYPQTAARVSYNLGNFHLDTKDFEGAKSYFMQGKELSENHDTELFILGRCLIGLANVAIAAQEHPLAENYLLQAIEIQEKYSDNGGKARSLNDLGNIAVKKQDYETAKKYYQQAIDIRRSLTNQQGYITTLLDLAQMHLQLCQASDSRRYADLALKIALSTNSKPKVARAYQIKSGAEELNSNYKEALEYFKKFFELQESILGTEQAIKIKQIESRFRQEIQDKEAEVQRLKNIELKEAYDKIERKNKDLTASINYAKRIQEAILPTDEEMSRLLPESFVVFLPRDIVSGDFYWVRKIGSKTVVAAVDCTGHGVPGAFMSKKANELLNTIVLERKITEPTEILTHLRRDIYTSLRQHQTQNRDGMDLSVATFDADKNRLVVGSARSYFAYFLDEKLCQIKGDNIAVGGEIGEETQFSQFEIQPNATLYLFSDGMADQFGGERQHKLMLSGLRDILGQAALLPIAEQKFYIENQFYKWLGTAKQIDDVMLLGIKFAP